MENNEIKELARNMISHTNKAINSAIAVTGFVLGTITESGLLLDNFKHPIINYMILDYLKLEDNYYSESEFVGDYSHSHEIKTPEKLKALKVGDRVLVAQMGADNVVIGRISNG